MKRLKVYANFEEALDPVIMIDSDKEVEVIIDYLIPYEINKPKSPDTIRFVATIQPEGHFNDLIKKYEYNYDYLLTFIPELMSLSKAKFFIATTAFCKPDLMIPKEFGVSAVFSSRNCLPGHALRHELWRRQDEITIPKYFYAGSRSGMTGSLVLGSDKAAKQEVMRTMYHIAIDSYSYHGSMSEKLIDPLITNTIPIYWGADVSSFFNMEGIFQCANVDEIIKVCNSLREADYYHTGRKFARLENYATSLEYHNYADCLQRKIQQICEHLK